MNAPLPRPEGFAYAPMFPLGAGPDPVWNRLPMDGVRATVSTAEACSRSLPRH